MLKIEQTIFQLSTDIKGIERYRKGVQRVDAIDVINKAFKEYNIIFSLSDESQSLLIADINGQKTSAHVGCDRYGFEGWLIDEGQTSSLESFLLDIVENRMSELIYIIEKRHWKFMKDELEDNMWDADMDVDLSIIKHYSKQNLNLDVITDQDCSALYSMVQGHNDQDAVTELKNQIFESNKQTKI